MVTKVSVIVPVYNEEKYIESCLKSIANQSCKADEIIVIDDGSTDASASVISNFSAKRRSASGGKFQISNFKMLKQKHQGPAITRNFGAKHAKGDILVFLDADMTFDKNFIRELIRPIIEKKEIATFTWDENVSNLDNILSR